MTSTRGYLRPVEGRTHQTTANGVRGEDGGGERDHIPEALFMSLEPAVLNASPHPSTFCYMNGLNWVCDTKTELVPV